jgi:purine-binding chemotaxis protein CheW
MVEGFFRYRGEVMPVLRLDRLLGLPRGGDHIYSHLLLLKGHGQPFALLAERVHDMVTVREGDTLPADPALSFNGCAVAVLPLASRAVTVLAADRLLTETEARLLAGLRAVGEERLAEWRRDAL